MEVKYIFGIIDSEEQKFFGNGGVNAYEEVYTMPYQDISLVVSDSQFIDYANLPTDHAARYLLRHQQIIESFMDSYTVIPMKLGTYASNFGEVYEILSKGYPIFSDIFGKIRNKMEMDVAATWNNLISIIKEIGEGEDIKRLKEKLVSRPEGVSVEDQAKVGGLIKDILDEKREKLASEMEDALRRVSIDSRSHHLKDDMMILNAAFLTDKSGKAEFEKRLIHLMICTREKLISDVLGHCLCTVFLLLR